MKSIQGCEWWDEEKNCAYSRLNPGKKCPVCEAFTIQTCEDLQQPEGKDVYWVVLGPSTGAPWEQKGFTTFENAQSAHELLSKLNADLQSRLAKAEEALDKVADAAFGYTSEHV
jgi:hypothetical protein